MTGHNAETGVKLLIKHRYIPQIFITIKKNASVAIVFEKNAINDLLLLPSRNNIDLIHI